MVLCSGLGGNTWAPSVEEGEENQGGMGRRQGTLSLGIERRTCRRKDNTDVIVWFDSRRIKRKTYNAVSDRRSVITLRVIHLKKKVNFVLFKKSAVIKREKDVCI